MIFHEWSYPIPITTSKGTGLLIASYDIGMDHHWYHMVVLDKDGSLWSFSNPDVRFTENETYGRIYGVLEGNS